MIQATIVAVEESTITKSKIGAAGPEFNKHHAHCFFSDMNGNVPLNTTVNYDFYCVILRRLRENVRRERPELWHNHNWLLLQGNGPAHTSLKTKEFVTNNNMVNVLHPPYSPYLAPMISLCFPN
jgi:hypothetical protein